MGTEYEYFGLAMEVPSFFVPAATAGDAESVYVGLAQRCNVAPPALRDRIYSVGFQHNGEQWTATVGKSLTGAHYTVRKGSGHETKRTLSDPAVVVAIFPGSPYQVMTNHGIVESVGSRWANPFYVGDPHSIVYFATPSPAP